MKKLYVFFFVIFMASFCVNAQTILGAVTNMGGDEYQLTRDDIHTAPWQSNGIWQTLQVNLATPFTVTAQLNFGVFNSTNLDPLASEGWKTGADGIAFVLAPSPYLGGVGEEIGYGSADHTTPINSFAVEFDTWQNTATTGATDKLDMADDHMAFMRRGMTYHGGPNGALNNVTPVISLGEIENGNWFPVTISWDPATGMTVNFNGIVMSTSAADVLGALGGTTLANWGFVAATAEGANDQRVRVSFENCSSYTVTATLPAIGCGAANTIYLGYGPQSITAVATPHLPVSTYTWYRIESPADIQVATGATFIPTQAGSYYVVATNGTCTDSTKGTAWQVTVVDIRCGKDNQNKVYICHKPNGNGNGVNGTIGGPLTLCVDASAVPAHLAHGDCLGECGMTLVTARMAPGARLSFGITDEPSVYPNPSKGQVQVELATANASKVQLLIVNSRGITVEQRTVSTPSQMLSLNLKKYGPGVYLVRIVSGSHVETKKVLVQD